MFTWYDWISLWLPERKKNESSKNRVDLDKDKLIELLSSVSDDDQEQLENIAIQFDQLRGHRATPNKSQKDVLISFIEERIGRKLKKSEKPKIAALYDALQQFEKEKSLTDILHKFDRNGDKLSLAKEVAVLCGIDEKEFDGICGDVDEFSLIPPVEKYLNRKVTEVEKFKITILDKAIYNIQGAILGLPS